MFNTAKTQLFDSKSNRKNETSDNPFIQQGLKKGVETLSGNGAKKYSSTGNEFVDQFGKLGEYKKPRSFENISKDMSILWAINPLDAIKFTLFIRNITRKTNLIDGTSVETVQRGSGLKHESIMRYMWIYTKDKNAFIANLPLFISAGSWRDVFEMLRYDLTYHGWENRILPWNEISTFIGAGLENPNTSELVKKYLPQLKARSKSITVRSQANTMIAKWITSEYKLTYKAYRKLKSSGTAHQWQKLISNKLYNEIDFKTIHGRALSQLVSSKFLTNSGLEAKYDAWIESQPIAKFTGYPHEIFEKYIGDRGDYYSRKLSSAKKYQINTINKQFEGLVETGKQNANCKSGLIVVRDTSSSMTSKAEGCKLSSHDIGKALALYFSYFLEGKFANTWIEFNNGATMRQWKGSTPVEKWINDNAEAYGSTNFLAVIDLFIKIKKQSVKESDFPTGIICISDGEFNRVGNLDVTNIQAARIALLKAGFSKDFVNNFQFVFWDIRNGFYGYGRSRNFESFGEEKGCFYFSGYDASTVAFLTGTETQKSVPKTDVELFEAAMNQELLSLVQL